MKALRILMTQFNRVSQVSPLFYSIKRCQTLHGLIFDGGGEFASHLLPIIKVPGLQPLPTSISKTTRIPMNASCWASLCPWISHCIAHHHPTA